MLLRVQTELSIATQTRLSHNQNACLRHQGVAEFTVDVRACVYVVLSMTNAVQMC